MELSEETDCDNLQRFERVRNSAFVLFSDSSQLCGRFVGFLRFIALEALRLVLLILEISSMIYVASRAGFVGYKSI